MSDSYIISNEDAQAIYDAIALKYSLASMTLGSITGSQFAQKILNIPAQSGDAPSPLTLNCTSAASAVLGQVEIRGAVLLTKSEYTALSSLDSAAIYLIVD